MATTTPNIGLSMPDSAEFASRQRYNANLEIIDTEFGKRKEIQSGTFTVSVPATADTTRGTVAHVSQSIGSGKTVLSTEIISPAGHIDDLKKFGVKTSVIRNPNNDEAFIVVDATKEGTGATSGMSITVKYYYI